MVVQIQLCCPTCGNSTWVPMSDGNFQCVFCDEVSSPEEMTARTKDVMAE